jgi:probable HAF family extracellular repeat protein
MKSRTLTCITAMTLFAALAVPLRLAAQDNRDHNDKHHHYKLIDIGTFGGPESSVPETNFLTNGKGDLNSRGLVVGGSATPTPTTGTSNSLVCGGLPFVFQAFEWQKGVVTNLGTLPGADNCSASSGINANGEIVGSSENGEIDPLTGINQSRPVRWKDSQITDLGTLGGYQGTAISINGRGQVVGVATNAIPDPIACFGLGTECRAFLWQDGQMHDLGTLGGPDAFAILINERGQVAGASNTNSIPTTDPFLWENGKMTDLGTLGGTFGFPLALNNRGQVVGQSNLVGDLTAHPFIWPAKDGKMLDLGTLGGSFGSANAINDAGEVVGVATNAGDQAVAFFWRNGVLTNLGTVDGDPCSTANAINSKGQVVGISTATCDFTTGRHAFLWENGSMVDLNTLVSPGSGLQLTLAETINDRGEIAGNGTPSDCGLVENCGHAFLLIPCDENHAGVEDCDFGLVDGSANATAASSIPATQRSTLIPDSAVLRRQMLRSFGRWMPWYRGLGASPRD